MAKGQLAETTKRLDQVEEAYAKYRLDAEARIDTLRTENSMVTVRLQQIQDQNEQLERTSCQS